MFKKVISMLIVLCMVLAWLPTDVYAVERGHCGPTVEWTLDNNGVLQIFGSGAMSPFQDYTAPWRNFRGSIKKVIVNSGVTSIGQYAFFDCNNITSVKLPNSVKRIDKYAFKNCYRLEEFNFPSGLTKIEERAFSDTAITRAEIPAGITTVNESVFYSCDKLTTVSFQGPITNIGDFAFAGCSALSDISFSGGLSGKIGENAFSGCKSLESFTIPVGVTHIQSSAFSGCSSLKSAPLPEGLTWLGSGAFSGTALTEVVIPSTVYFETGVYTNCNELQHITMYSSTAESMRTSLGVANGLVDAHIIGDAPQRTEKIFGNQDDRFIVYYDEGTSGWQPPTWNGYVIEVWGSTDYTKTGTCGDNLTWTLRDGVLTISGTGEMTDQSSESAPWYVYRGRIERVVIEDGVTSIGSYAFWNLDNLVDVSIAGSVTRVGEWSFSDCAGLTEIEIPEGVATIESNAFSNCIYLQKVTIADTVTTMGDSVFDNCFRLLEVKLSAGLKEIPSSAFYDCSNLESIVIPDGVERIGDNAFNSCFNLREVTIPDSVKAIGSYSFSRCGFSRIVIPASVSEVGSFAFAIHSKLKYVIFLGDAPTIDAYAFHNVTTCCIYPEDNATWTEEVMQDYGGDLTWCTEIPEIPTMPVYRLYNPYTLEHLFTGGAAEKDALAAAGWIYEGIAWYAPESGIPVYRLYNPYTDGHFYTVDEAEMNDCVEAGWKYDGIVSYAVDPDAEGATPVFRLFNPYETKNYHHYTAGVDERDTLECLGWIYEGIAWHALVK